jgi:hypothetical protein
VTVRTVAADTSTNYTGPKWSLLPRKEALAAAVEINPAHYPDCDEAVVDRKMVRVYRADGTGESQDESYVKLLTEKGKRNNRTLSLGFMLPYFTVDVVNLEVIKPDGTVNAVDIAANSKESIDDSQMSMNIYDPNSKRAQDRFLLSCDSQAVVPGGRGVQAVFPECVQPLTGADTAQRQDILCAGFAPEHA